VSARVPLKTASASSHESRTWHVRFDREGWACITVCDRTGCVAVISDWLNGTYRWNVSPSALGAPTLTAFLVRCDAWYLCNKLFRGQHEEVDSAATIAGVRKHVVEARRRGELERDQARDLWREAAESFDLADPSTDLREFLDYEPWNFIRHRETPAHRVMREEILPKLQAQVAITLAEQAGVTP
jgi:hypothetical protein